VNLISDISGGSECGITRLIAEVDDVEGDDCMISKDVPVIAGEMFYLI